MVAQITGEGINFGGLISQFKVDVNSYEQVISDFKKLYLKSDQFKLENGKTNWTAITEDLKTADALAISYFKTLEDGNGTVKNASASVEGMSAYVNESGKEFDFAAIKASLFNSVLNAGIFLVASLAIQGIATAIDNYVHRAEKAIETTKSLKSKHKDLNSEYESHKKLVDECAASYEKLSRGVDTSTNENLSLSTDDYQEYLNVTNQLAEAFPTLYQTLDENGNAILTLGQNGRTAAEDLRELLEAEENLNNYKVAQDIDGLFGGVKVKMEEANAELEQYKNSSAEIERNYDVLKDISNGSLLPSDEDVHFSGDTSKAGGLEYYQALTNAIYQFYNSLDNERREFLPSFDTSNIHIQDNGLFDFWLSTSVLTESELQRLSEAIKTNTEDTLLILQEEVKNGLDQKNLKKQEADLAWRDFLPSLVSTLKSMGSFEGLAEDAYGNEIDGFGEDIQKLALDLVSGLDSETGNEIGDDVKGWLREHIILPLSQLDSGDRKEITKAYNQLLTLDPNDLSLDNRQLIDNLINTIAGLLGEEDVVKLRLNLGFVADDASQTRYNSFVDKWGQIGANLLSGEDLEIAYKVDNNSIKLWTDLLAKIKEYKSLVSSGDMTPFKKEQMISGLNGLSEGFESIDKIFASIKDDDPFDFALLDDQKFKDTFSEIDGYSDFIETITSFPNNIEKCRPAFDDLVSTWIENEEILNHVDEANANVAKSMLKVMGVANAEQLVANALAQRKAELVFANEEVHASTEQELIDLAAEQELTGETAQAFYAYYIQKILANDGFDPTGDIQGLETTIESLGIATNAWLEYQKIKARISDIADGKYLVTDDYGHELDKETSMAWYEGQAKLKLKEYSDSLTAKYGKVDYSAGNRSNKSSGSGSGSQDSDIDWIERRISLIKQRNEELESALSDTYTKYTGLTREEIQRVDELLSSELQPGSTAADELIALAAKAGMSITDLQAKLQNGGLESRQSILEEMMQNQIQIIDEYEKAIPQYRESYENLVAKIPAEYREKIENGSIDIELVPNNIKSSIDDAKNAYDKMHEMQVSQIEAERQLRDYRGQWHDTYITELEKEASTLENQRSILEAQIAYLEASGHIVSASLYEDNISNLESQSQKQSERLKRLRNKLSDLDPEEDTEEYYELKDAVDDCEKSVVELETSAAEARNELLQLPIKHQEIIVGMAQDIVSAIQDYGSEIEATGGILDEKYYKVLISNGAKVTDELQKQADLIQDTMGEYEVGSDQWNDLYSQLKSVNSEMSSMVTNLKKWNEEMLQLPLDKMNTYSSNLNTVKEALVEIQNDYETVINAVTSAIDDETKKIQDQQEEYQKSINKQIEAIQDKMDLLDKQNEKLRLQRELEQSLYDLQVANTQKTEKVK